MVLHPVENPAYAPTTFERLFSELDEGSIRTVLVVSAEEGKYNVLMPLSLIARPHQPTLNLWLWRRNSAIRERNSGCWQRFLYRRTYDRVSYIIFSHSFDRFVLYYLYEFFPCKLFGWRQQHLHTYIPYTVHTQYTRTCRRVGMEKPAGWLPVSF